MLTLFSLNNPLTAPIMIMCAAFVLGGGVASLAFLIGRKFYYDKRVQEYAKAETARLHAQLDACLEANDTLKAQNLAMKQKIGAMSLYLGKAVTEARIDE